MDRLHAFAAVPSSPWAMGMLLVGLGLLASPAAAQDAPAPSPAPAAPAATPAPPPAATPPATPAPPPAATPPATPAAKPAPSAAAKADASAAPAAGDSGGLPDHPTTALAKAAYNAGKYGEAIGHFRSLARRWPANGAVYRALARAYTWDGKTNQAITAYRDYLTLAPDAGDREKIQAELDLVLRKSKTPPKAGPPKGVTKALARIKKRVEAGRLGGKDGAVAAHQKLMGGPYVGPALARARDAVHGALVSRSEGAIAAWWSPAESVSGDTTGDLTSAWKTLSEIDAPAPRNARILTTAVAGLDHLLAGRHAEAVTVLEPVAPGDLRLRYAQAVALLGAKRVDEAKQLLTALARGDADPRIHLVLGLLGGANAKPEGIDRLHQALSKP